MKQHRPCGICGKWAGDDQPMLMWQGIVVVALTLLVGILIGLLI